MADARPLSCRRGGVSGRTPASLAHIRTRLPRRRIHVRASVASVSTCIYNTHPQNAFLYACVHACIRSINSAHMRNIKRVEPASRVRALDIKRAESRSQSRTVAPPRPANGRPRPRAQHTGASLGRREARRACVRPTSLAAIERRACTRGSTRACVCGAPRRREGRVRQESGRGGRGRACAARRDQGTARAPRARRTLTACAPGHPTRRARMRDMRRLCMLHTCAGYAGAGYAGAGYAGAGYAGAGYAGAGYAGAGYAGTGYAGAGYAGTGYAGAGYACAV
jgi:hypothetical protein